MKNKKLIPQLRFLGFHDIGEWEKNILSNIAEINPSEDFMPEEFFYIDLESVKEGKLLNTKRILLENAPSRAQRIIKNNDILFQLVRPYQKNNLFVDFIDNSNLPYVASTGYALIRIKNKKKINPKFLYYFIHTDSFVDKAIRYSTGALFPSINTEDLKKFKIFYPSLPEQKKIADFLSKIDALIELYENKLNQLQEYKRGLLQNLFPIQGSKVPHYRFPEFRNAGEWEEVSLITILSEYTKRNLEEYEPVSIGIHGIRQRKEIYSKPLSKNIKNNKVIYKNTFTLGIGTKQIVFGVLTEDTFFSVSPAYSTFKINTRIVDPFFFNELIKFLIPELSEKYLLISAREGKSVDKEYFLKHIITIPNIEEQKEIADFLKKIDTLIQLTDEKLEHLKTYKKGLLQQMFPEIE